MKPVGAGNSVKRDTPALNYVLRRFEIIKGVIGIEPIQNDVFMGKNYKNLRD
jgi:hypothetical protein